MDRCRLTHAGANLQGFGNLGDKAGPLYASFSCPVSSRRFPNAGVSTTQSRRLPQEDADQIYKDGRQTDPWTNKRAKVAKWAVSKAATARADGKMTKRVPSPTTSSTAVAATWTSAPDVTSTTLTMSCISTTPSSADLATLITVTFILDNFKSNSNLEINLHKNLFRKFFYPQLILFFYNAL